VPGVRSAADIELHTGYCFVAGGRRERCQRVLIPTSGPTTMRYEMHATYRERRSRICRCIVPTGRGEFKTRMRKSMLSWWTHPCVQSRSAGQSLLGLIRYFSPVARLP